MTRSLQILVIDDDDVDREQLRRLLARAEIRFDVAEAPDAEAALNLIETEAFDCVLLDCHLPGTNGVDLIARLKRSDRAVLMISGQNDENVAAEALAQGANGYLYKGNICAQSLQQFIVEAVGAMVRI